MNIQENVPLAPLTTFKVGGPARYFAEATRLSEVSEAVDFANARALPLFVLGGGSNLVVSDAGWQGMVLRVAVAGTEQRKESGKAIFEVGAGEEWDKFVACAVGKNCAGIECLSGIPGSVGGTPVQNVGAYGQEVSETIHSVLALDLKDGQLREFCNEACGFSYRASIFNTTERGRFIIVRVTYALTPDGDPRIHYADLKKHFIGWSRTPSLADTRHAVRQIRAAKGMLISTDDPDSRSAGSFFKNPVLSQAAYDDLVKLAAAKGLTVPSYPTAGSLLKISAAWLVERSGFAKGFSDGNVGLSRKHALAIVNLGGATAAEIVALKEHIQERVKEIWGIALHPEPVFVGF